MLPGASCIPQQVRGPIPLSRRRPVRGSCTSPHAGSHATLSDPYLPLLGLYLRPVVEWFTIEAAKPNKKLHPAWSTQHSPGGQSAANTPPHNMLVTLQPHAPSGLQFQLVPGTNLPFLPAKDLSKLVHSLWLDESAWVCSGQAQKHCVLLASCACSALLPQSWPITALVAPFFGRRCGWLSSTSPVSYTHLTLPTIYSV